MRDFHSILIANRSITWFLRPSMANQYAAFMQYSGFTEEYLAAGRCRRELESFPVSRWLPAPFLQLGAATGQGSGPILFYIRPMLLPPLDAPCESAVCSRGDSQHHLQQGVSASTKSAASDCHHHLPSAAFFVAAQRSPRVPGAAPKEINNASAWRCRSTNKTREKKT